MDAATLLDAHFAIPGSDYPNIFLLGCRSRRVTVYDQQVRAINLISALVAAKRIDKHDKVAIVGGGIAGLTAAVAAGRIGARVDVFEESIGEESAIKLQRSSRQRLLHPRIYDWPTNGFQEEKTGIFPFMNWSATMSDVVTKSLLGQWQKEKASSSIQYEDSHHVTTFERKGDTWTIVSMDKPARDGYRIVILAVGFGLERTVAGRALQSYWRDYDVDPPLDHDLSQKPARYLVAGDGDGALIDVLRILLRDFSHDTLLTDLKLGDSTLQPLRDKLIQIEGDAKTHGDPPSFLQEEYDRLNIPVEFTDQINRLVRRQTDVVLLATGKNPFGLHSSVLHRFLISILMRQKLISFFQGKLDCVDGTKPSCTAQCTPPLINPAFYDVIVRIGAERALEKFSKIASACPILSVGEEDPTRDPRTAWWKVFDKPAPAPLVTVTSTGLPTVGYFVAGEDDARYINSKGFAEHHKQPLASGLALPLYVKHEQAARNAQSKGATVFEVQFATSLQDARGKRKKPPPRTSFLDDNGGVEIIGLVDIETITSWQNASL